MSVYLHLLPFDSDRQNMASTFLEPAYLVGQPSPVEYTLPVLCECRELPLDRDEMPQIQPREHGHLARRDGANTSRRFFVSDDMCACPACKRPGQWRSWTVLIRQQCSDDACPVVWTADLQALGGERACSLAVRIEEEGHGCVRQGEFQWQPRARSR